MEVRPIKHGRGEATRQAILSAAERIFAEIGYHAARLEDVAIAVGIRRPSIIYYFKNKQELYDAVEADIFEAMHHQARQRMEGIAHPMEQLLALLDAWLDFQVGRPTAARIILRLVADVTPRHGDPTQFSQSALQDMETVIEEGVRQKLFRPVAPMHIINAVAASGLFYVCNSDQFGDARRYEPADPTQLAAFRDMLHLIARAAVAP